MLTLKKNHHKFLYVLAIAAIITLVTLSPVFSQTGEGGTKSLFTDAGAGARALSLGQAYVALADDPSAVFWNPAGLDYLQKKSATFFYTTAPFGISHNFIGLAFPTTSIGSFGFGWVRIATNDIENRDGATGTLLGTGNYSQNQFLFSYGKLVTRSFGVGASLKLENYSLLSNISDTGVGGDLGVMFRPDFDNEILRDLSFGLNVQNIWSPSVQLQQQDETSPFNFRIGLAKPVTFGEDRNQLMFLFDINKGDAAPMSFHAGTEFSFRDAADVRIGFNDGQFAVGAGAYYRNIHFDYNFGKLHQAEAFSTNHRFSLTIEFGRTKTELIRFAEDRREKEIQFRRDQELWFQHEQDYHGNIEAGRQDFYREKNYLSAFVKFNAAKEAAEQLVAVAMRLRGDGFDDPEANDRVFTANSLLDEAGNLQSQAETKSDSVRIEERKQFALQQTQIAIEQDLQGFVLNHREKGNEFFKNGFFTNAIREWQLVLDRAGSSELKNVGWVTDVRTQLEKSISNAQDELEGNVQETIKRANRMVRRGQYRQALDELYKLRGAGLKESERQTVEGKIVSLQQQLSFDQHFDEGVRYYQAKQWKEAADAFKRATKIKSNHSRAKEYYDNAYARSIATRQQMPSDVRVQYFKAAQFYREGKIKEALDLFEACRQKQPFNKDILDSIDRAKQRLEKR